MTEEKKGFGGFGGGSGAPLLGDGYEGAPTGDEEELFDESQMFGMCSLEEDEELSAEILKRTEVKPFSAFGSYRQRYGEGTQKDGAGGMSAEAPAKLETGLFRTSSDPTDLLEEEPAWASDVSSPAVEIVCTEKQRKRGHHRKPRRFRSLTNLMSRDEAWERRSNKVMLQELEQMKEDNRARAVGRSASDCGDHSWPRSSTSHSRTRSLTDEDLDELRGCIDLGFGFSNEREDPELCNTLPALELCYAIARSYNDAQSRASPVSTLDHGSGMGGSLTNSPKHSWTISSPGDPPQQVKTRLRHWAQAVACTVRQSC